MQATPPLPFAPPRLLVGVSLAVFAALPLCAMHARFLRKNTVIPAHPLLVYTGPELPLGTAARWLRHRAQAEPHAAVVSPELPFDQEPAGLLLRPLPLTHTQHRILPRISRSSAP